MESGITGWKEICLGIPGVDGASGVVVTGGLVTGGLVADRLLVGGFGLGARFACLVTGFRRWPGSWGWFSDWPGGAAPTTRVAAKKLRPPDGRDRDKRRPIAACGSSYRSRGKSRRGEWCPSYCGLSRKRAGHRAVVR